MNSMCELWEGASYESQRSHTPVLEKTDGNIIVGNVMILEIQRFGNSMNTTFFNLHKDADSTPKKKPSSVREFSTKPSCLFRSRV